MSRIVLRLCDSTCFVVDNNALNVAPKSVSHQAMITIITNITLNASLLD